RSDEELENETKFKSAALAILGARAAERYDAKTARDYFRRAIAAARPQERMQLRRMADASLALAERRPDDLKEAVERLGQAPPSGKAADHAAEDRVLRRQGGVLRRDDEELAARRPGLLDLRLGHCHHGTRVLGGARRRLDDRVAGVAVAGAGRVAALDHEVVA